MDAHDLLKALLIAWLGGTAASAQPAAVLDLAAMTTDGGDLSRVLGASGSGSFGVPVTPAADMDGDGFADTAIAFLTASPGGVYRAGEVDLVFGDDTVSGTLDTAFDSARVLRIYGEQATETAGSEVWSADVTGDGRADLLICRQNYSPVGRIGAGALSIVVGKPGLRSYAATLQPLLLAAPPAAAKVTTVLGDPAGGRFCVWLRTGDVDGDGTDDVVVGADQESTGLASHHGAVYVLRGGAHLAAGGTYNLDDWAQGMASPLAGLVARVAYPETAHAHFGATCLIADLDGNGRGEVLAAATLNRAGAGIAPAGGIAHASGGVGSGQLTIVWDDNFSGTWPSHFELTVDALPGSQTKINGGLENVNFGEEMVGGLDFDGDTTADVFVGDLTGDGTPGSTRFRSGLGYLFYGAASLKGLSFSMNSPPMGVDFTKILGPAQGALGADTAARGDFNGDGLGDLVFCSPHASPQGRTSAGVTHLFLGRAGGWPATVDIASLPAPAVLETIEIQGAKVGDTLCYSGAAGDLDGDGRPEIVLNEMLGDGSSAVDVGNLIHVRPLPSPRIFRDGFESGTTAAWSSVVP